MRLKYYYSMPQQIRRGYFISDVEGNVIYEYANTEFVKNTPRVTICTILNDKTLSFGYTVCSSKDQYIKKLGQRISKARAEKRPYKVITIEDLSKIHEITNDVIDEIFDIETKRIFKL